MLALKEEQLNMVSGGAAAMQNEVEDSGYIPAGCLVLWTGHENLGVGLCDFDLFGTCVVEYETKAFPGFYVKLIKEDELVVVGHVIH